MKTYSFVGSDKNAGKTTAFNFIYRRLCRDEEVRARLAGNPGGGGGICLTSIGINGEAIDSHDGGKKPEIRLSKDTYFLTAGEHLHGLGGHYRILSVFRGITRTYVAGRCLADFSVTLEGPNSGREVLAAKARLEASGKVGLLLIDGSIDRQFLARPTISDGLYFALLLSDRKIQLRKVHDLLFSLNLPVCGGPEASFISRHRDGGTRSLLFAEPLGDDRLLYRGTSIAAFDLGLQEACRKQRKGRLHLYLDGALSRTLAAFLAPFRNLDVILDNFTQYQDASAGWARASFLPQLSLLHGVRTRAIFLKQEHRGRRPDLPQLAELVQTMKGSVPMYNIFRENPHEIVI